MNDYTQYHANQARIAELEAELIEQDKVFERELIAQHKANNKRIAILLKQSEVNRAGKNQAITARNKAMEGKASLVKSLLRLVLIDRIDLTNEEISELCFVTKQSVANHKWRLKTVQDKELGRAI